MKRILALVKKDLKYSLRDNILAYGLLGPLVLAVLLRLFIPALGANSIDVAVLDSEAPAFVQEVGRFAETEQVGSLDEMYQRVNHIDDTVGFVRKADGTVTIIMEGNEDKAVREIAEVTANKLAGVYKAFPVQVRDLGLQETSPFLPYIGAFSALMALLLGGFILGFNIIEEKETRTISALNVSPLRRWEFIVGHSLTGLILALFMTFGMLLILFGYGEVNYAQVLVFALSGVIVSILFGFLMGALSTNQVTGIANGKIGFMLFILAPIVTLIISESREFLLYWVPTYWTFAGFRAILVEGAAWNEVWRLAGWHLVLNVLFFAVLYRPLKKRLLEG